MKRILISAAVVAAAAGASVAQTDIVKPPDLGPWWNPINANGGTYVYASDFVAPADDTLPTKLGMWLLSHSTDGPSIRFEIWGDTGGAGPDPFNILASTGSIGGFTNDSLTFYEANVAFANHLTPGSRYWFAATVVGEAGSGFYQTGGHTQNSVYPDNGTFWYSNDAAGVFFDGQNLTPQIAFAVSLIPAPGAAGLLGVAGLMAARRRR